MSDPVANPSEHAAVARKVQIPFVQAEIDQIDDVRFAQRHQSRTETIRYLIFRGLEATVAEAPTHRGETSARFTDVSGEISEISDEISGNPEKDVAIMRSVARPGADKTSIADG
ncbi:MAG: hypothetical protein K0S00_3095 [Xanthobacteraceae bacterium]|nr:hypothetical protein [Xanthobacteraceae bacterium]